jgi:hypothetical protein
MAAVETGSPDDLVMRKRNITVARRYGTCSHGTTSSPFRTK